MWLRAKPLLVFWAIVFIFSGLVVNVIQLLSLVLWPINRKLYREINAKVVLLNWTMLICLAERWANVKLRLFGDADVYATLGTRKAICMLNHASDLDWLFGWLIADKFSVLGLTKCVLKSDLRLVPVLGWSWWLVEYIFLRRDWENDRAHMTRCFRTLDDFHLPYWMVIFCEGTRFTVAKHAQSVAYCLKAGLKPLKHLLYPRVKGFQLMRAQLHTAEDLLHVTFAFPGGGVPTLTDLVFDARTIEVHCHIHREPIAACPPGDDDAGCTDYVVRTYTAMDARLEHHAQHGVFAGPECVRPRSLFPLVVSLGWSAVLAALLASTLGPRVLAGDYFAFGAAAACYALGYGMVQLGLWFTKKGKHGGASKNKTT